jgi:hypothetical protein
MKFVTLDRGRDAQLSRAIMKVMGTLLLVAVHVGARAAAVEYSTAPLEQSPIMSSAEVVVDFAKFNNWLVEHQQANPRSFPQIREHAYLLVDSVLKLRQSEGRADLTEFDRVVLTEMFNWSTRFGIYGAGLAAKEFTTGKDRELTEPLLPQKPNRLRLEFPYFVVSSKAAEWELRFPYYFMLWGCTRYKANNGLLTDMALLSTSFAKHDKGEGLSQATIMFIYSPKADCKKFDGFWLGMIGIAETGKTDAEPLPSSTNYYAYDEPTNMHKEVTLLAEPTGCYAIAYSGIGGPYQANRVSYLDFMKTLRRAEPAGH